MNLRNKITKHEKKMDLFDAHCHLQDQRFANDITNVIFRARSTGISKIAIKGSTEKDWLRVELLSKNEDNLYPSFGLHPWFLKERTSLWKERLLRLLDKYSTAGVGEIGIDSNPKGMDGECIDIQEKIFRIQLDIARQYKRPVSIHCRSDWARLLSILDSVGDLPGGFMIHCFGGSFEIANELLNRGAYLSFSGTITRPNNKKAWKVLPMVPTDRILLETDAPDIIPHNAEGLINEPSNLRLILSAAAHMRGEDENLLASFSFQNACNLFTKN